MQLFENLESEGKTNQNIEKIAFKVVQMKLLAMHITNQKLVFLHIYGRKFTKYLNGTWSFLNILMIFGIKLKYVNVLLLAIATNIPVLHKTGFVAQCHILAGAWGQ